MISLMISGPACANISSWPSDHCHQFESLLTRSSRIFESTSVTRLLPARHGHDFIGRETRSRAPDQIGEPARRFLSVCPLEDNAAIGGTAEFDLAAGHDAEMVA